MNCANCGAPLQPPSDRCEHCETINDTDLARCHAAPAQVPTRYAAGPGAPPGKSRRESEREIFDALQAANAVAEAQTRAGRLRTLVLLGLLLLGLVVLLHRCVRRDLIAHGYCTAGYAQLCRREFPYALVRFQDAMRLDPGYAEPHYLTGLAWYVRFQRERVLPRPDARWLEECLTRMEPSLRTAVALDADLAQAHFYLAMWHFERGAYAKASQEMDACAALIRRTWRDEARIRCWLPPAEALGRLLRDDPRAIHVYAARFTGPPQGEASPIALPISE